MKKLLLFTFLLIPCISFAERVVVVHEHKYIVEKTITNYETKTINVKEWEYQGVTFTKVGDTITLKSDTFTITVKKTGIKPIPVIIEP